MHRDPFLQDLSAYARTWGSGSYPYPHLSLEEEHGIVPLFEAFIRGRDDCFERTCEPGHITGSALVVSKDLKRVLLTLHGKLNMWLQLGGHADGEAAPHRVAMREAEEESGLTKLSFLPHATASDPNSTRQRPLPFDLDRHLIAARPGEPAHFHYDVRYLILGDPQAPLGITPESKDLRWFTMSEARDITRERSMLRQFDKIAWLRDPKNLIYSGASS